MAAAIILVVYYYSLLILCSLVRSSLAFVPVLSATNQLRHNFEICNSMDATTTLFHPTVGLTTAAVEKAIAAGEREAERNGWKMAAAAMIEGA